MTCVRGSAHKSHTTVDPTERSPPDVDDDAVDLSTAPPPSVVVDDDSASTAAVAAEERKVRKVVKKVIVKKVVPKGTFAARKAAAEAEAVVAVAGASSSSSETGEGGETPTGNPPTSDQGSLVGNGQKLEESDGEKPAIDCNAVPVEEESAVVVGEGATFAKPATEEGEVVGEELVVDKGIVEVETEEEEEEEEAGMSERQKRMTMEVFVGGLHRDAKEEDVREAFGKAGDITDVRMIMSPIAGKNKGYCFVRFRNAAQARKAISEFGNVKICGKRCRAAVPVGNDRIFLGNINKKWKKEDIIKLLKKIGIENIDSVTLKPDSNNPVYNRGFAYLELETSRDTWMAYRKLSRKNAFGDGLNINVAWAESLYDRQEKDMQVKSIFVDGIPTSWDHAELKEIFKKHGKIESVVLSRDMQSAKRKDFAFINYITHEAATSCLESFDKEEFTANGSKVNIKVSLARPVQQSKQIKEDHNIINGKSKMKTSQTSYYGLAGIPISSQVRQASSHKLTQSYGSRHAKKSD
uniref:RRM domain-containing protein n=1 Tax=Leersia perrieri TaxID=77586 RepID=A0A0D9WW69_9ORYZ